ncbi:MAG: hypothetical protein ISS56_11525 [Anaerolineae bacterium]|jgi:hypothetical protein|nr:hypothetical protein [Anaerolineae bacterium]
MVKKSFALTIDGKTFQVEVLRPGTISVDGNVYNVEVGEDGVRINDEALVASLSEEFAIVGGKLYETTWSTE